MNLNDYESAWKRQELPVGANADLKSLQETFETKRRKLAATLMARDCLEATTGILVSGLLAYFWWHFGKEGWPMAFAIALILGVSGFFVRERLRAHSLRLGTEAPLLAKIEADITELRRQRHLLLNIGSWYLLPLAASIIVVCITAGRAAPPGFLAALREHPAALAWVILYIAVILPLCFWGAWALNRRHVRKQIEPRLQELEQLRTDLLSSQ